METPQAALDSQVSTALEEQASECSEAAEESSTDDSSLKSLPSSQAAFLNSNVQEIVSAINDKRKRDLTLLADFKSELESRCEAAYSSMQSTVFTTYNQTNSVLESKLQELLQVIQRISLLESELVQFKSAFSSLYTELNAP